MLIAGIDEFRLCSQWAFVHAPAVAHAPLR